MRITALPDIDKFLFVAGFDLESVHCDIHRNLDLFYGWGLKGNIAESIISLINRNDSTPAPFEHSYHSPF
jgi:hypothetical protein